MSKEKAQKAKAEGNAAFKDGDYPTAIGHYTSAVMADRTEPTYYLNRAAAYLKLGKNEDAERDCTSVLDLRKGDIKALFRRGQARLALGKLHEARRDLSDVLLQDTSNLAAQEEMKKLTLLMQQEQAKKPKTRAPASLVNTSAASSPPVKRRRVPIEVVDASGNPAASQKPRTPNSQATGTTSASSPSNRPDLLEAVSMRALSGQIQPTQRQPMPESQSTTSTNHQQKSFADAKVSREVTKPSRVTGGVFRASGDNNVRSTVVYRSQDASPRPSDELSSPISQARPESASTGQADISYSCPTTVFDFRKTWDSIPTSAERWRYLTVISPNSLPTLCKTSLEPAFLISILNTFLSNLQSNAGDDELREHMVDYLEWFGRVPRFSTVALFFSKEEKETARTLLKELGLSSNGAWKAIA